MDSNIPGNTARIQTPSSEGQDRISSLPDEILSHLLSFIPTKSAAQTVVLSKRWKHPWLSVSVLDFDQDHRARFILKFTHFMYRLFAARGNSSIRKFRLSCYAALDSRSVCDWMNSIAMRHVEELDLCLDALKWSHLNFAGESMKVMKLGFGILIDIPSTISFPSLKTLHLNSVQYEDELSIRKLLSSCPVLENLLIDRSEWDEVSNFVISVPSLKWLDLYFAQGMALKSELVDTDDYIECRLQIDAPNVEYLKIYDVMSESTIVSPMPFVTESYVSVNKTDIFGPPDDQARNHGNSVSALFRSISNVKKLTIADFTINSFPNASDTRLPTFCNLLHLEVTIIVVGEDVAILLPSLLEASPMLETLILPNGVRCPNSDYAYIWRPPQNVPQCLLVTLKVVVIGSITGKKGEIKLLKYLLKNAMALEKMTISCHEDIVLGGPDENVEGKLAADRALVDRFPYRHDLLNCARGSTKCELVLEFPE